MGSMINGAKQVLHKINAAIAAGKYSKECLSLGLLLNLLDAAFTLYFVGGGYAQEANPIMAYYLDQSSMAFLIMKMYMSTVCLGILYLYRERRPAMIGLYSALGVYSGVVLMHIVWAFVLFFGG